VLAVLQLVAILQLDQQQLLDLLHKHQQDPLLLLDLLHKHQQDPLQHLQAYLNLLLHQFPIYLDCLELAH
jgi:hypothetical protein